MISLWTMLGFYQNVRTLSQLSTLKIQEEERNRIRVGFTSFTKVEGRMPVRNGNNGSVNHTKSVLNEQQQRLGEVVKEVDDLLYWNLSCPLEMSSFSASRMGGPKYLPRALQALAVARPAWESILRNFVDIGLRDVPRTGQNHTRRIVFVGDSLLRQVFISLSCVMQSQEGAQVMTNTSIITTTVDIAVPWFSRRTGRTNHPNTISIGPHSKFEESRVWIHQEHRDRTLPHSDNFFTTTELIYHHGIGNVVSLGQDYRSHDEHVWMEACLRGRPLEATVVQRGRHTEQFVRRETISLGKDDVVIFNGSVHGDRQLNLYNIQDIANCINTNRHNSKNAWPKLLYMVTSAEHFPTVTGQYDETLSQSTNVSTSDAKTPDYQCRKDAVLPHGRLREEQTILARNAGGGATNLLHHPLQQADHPAIDNSSDPYLLPFVGLSELDLEYRSGDLHVGGRDCLHWIMPGIPDLLAASLLEQVVL